MPEPPEPPATFEYEPGELAPPPPPPVLAVPAAIPAAPPPDPQLP